MIWTETNQSYRLRNGLEVMLRSVDSEWVECSDTWLGAADSGRPCGATAQQPRSCPQPAHWEQSSSLLHNTTHLYFKSARRLQHKTRFKLSLIQTSLQPATKSSSLYAPNSSTQQPLSTTSKQIPTSNCTPFGTNFRPPVATGPFIKWKPLIKLY